MPLALQKTIFFIMHLFCFWAVAQEDSRFNESLEAYLRKDYQKAEKILVPLAQENPEKSLYWFNLGTSQYMLKRYSLAVASFDKVIKLDKTFVVMANVYKAKSLKKLGRNEEAKILLETQLQKATLPSGFKKLALLELQELQSIDSAEDSALEKYREGSFSESESRLNGVGAENLSIDGRILFILTKLKQNNSFETERYIEDQLKSLALTVSQRKVFSDLLRKSKQDDKTYAPKWLFVDVSYGQTSNVYYDGLSISLTASPIVRSTVGGGFHFNSQIGRAHV